MKRKILYFEISGNIKRKKFKMKYNQCLYMLVIYLECGENGF